MWTLTLIHGLHVATRSFAGLLLLLAAASTAPSAATSQDEHDQLVIGITQFPTTFHPAINAMMAKTYILSMTRRTLTAYDPDWNLVCLLCTRLPTIENGLAVPERTESGAQGIAVTYSIHEDATWGDGEPVTTDDIVFSWQVGRHPKSGYGNAELYRRIVAIDAVDDKTFTLHFDRLTFDYNDIGGFDIVPAHIERLNFSDPIEYKNRTAYDTDTTNEALYFGPYVITVVEPGSHVVLEPNPTWWGDAPGFDRIVVRVIENTAALEANLLSGGIDMIAGELGLTLDQALAFEKRHGNEYQVIYKPGLVYEHIDLNLDNPILSDRRVRKALIHAIDRQAISERLFEGQQPVAHTMVNPLDWVYADDVPRYTHDRAEAVRLLVDAGWTVMRQGVRENADGDKLTLELMSTAGNRNRELVEQVLQNQWSKVGIDVRIRNQPARVFFGETVTERRFSAMAMFAWISAPESVPRTTLHSAHIPSASNNYAGQNYTGFRNAEMDSLIEQVEVELDRGRRRALWRSIQEIYVEELPVIPLYFRANPYVLPKWLKGVTPTGHQYPSTLWVEDWRALP